MYAQEQDRTFRVRASVDTEAPRAEFKWGNAVWENQIPSMELAVKKTAGKSVSFEEASQDVTIKSNYNIGVSVNSPTFNVKKSGSTGDCSALDNTDCRELKVYWAKESSSEMPIPSTISGNKILAHTAEANGGTTKPWSDQVGKTHKIILKPSNTYTGVLLAGHYSSEQNVQLTFSEKV
jgi:hypothetical protein